MPDRIVTVTAADGSFSIVSGITTALVRETQMRHELSPTASAALGRLVTGAALLGASLKGRERLSLQIAGDGPLGRLVADAELQEGGAIGARAYVQGTQADVPLNARGKFDVAAAVGRGYLQVTRSFEVGQPYVGVVPLASGEIGDDIAAYLGQSQQIPSVVALGVLANPEGIVAAGGAIAQLLPGAHEETVAGLEARAQAMDAVTTQIARGASAEDLARSLAGDVPLRGFAEYAIGFRCRCTRERVEVALIGLGRDELRKIVSEQQQTEAVCEFCKQRFVLSRAEMQHLIERLEARS